MPTSPYIQIVLKNDVHDNWLAYDDVNHILAQGEVGVVWKAQLSPQNQPLFEDDGVTPKAGTLLFEVTGDGLSTFSQLVPKWPVRKGSFNSVVSNRQGTARDLENLASTSATATYQTMDELVDALVHPYAKPQFTSFAPGGFTSIEVGLPLNRNAIAFAWSSSNPQNVQPNSVLLRESFAGATTVLASGKNGNDSFQPTGLSTRIGTAIGQTIAFTLTGFNTKGDQLSPVGRGLSWEGQRVLFVHPDTEWLLSGLTAKPGDSTGTLIGSDPALATLLNAKLDDQDLRDDGFSRLGNGSFGTQNLNGGTAGGRAYALYPVAYRTQLAFIDPAFNVPQAPTVSRTITLTRHGVSVPYILFALDLRIVQVLASVLS